MSTVIKHEGDTWGAFANGPAVNPRGPTSNVVTYMSVDGTARAGQDYQAGSGTLTAAQGAHVDGPRFAVFNDDVYEGTENFFVPGTASSGTFDPTTFLIADDDDIPSIAVEQASLVVIPGQTGTITLILSNTSAIPITISLSPSGDSASIFSVPSSVAVQPGARSVDIPVQASAAGSTLSSTRAALDLIATVVDPYDGSSHRLSFSSQASVSLLRPVVSISPITVNEGDTDHIVLLTLKTDAAASVDYAVHLTAADGSAVKNRDYSFIPHDITIPAGSTSVSLPLNIVGDKWPDSRLTADFTVNAQTSFSSSSTTITISKDDFPYGLDNVVKTALDIAHGDPGAAHGLVITQRVLVGGSDEVYRDAEYYLLGYEAGFTRDVGKIIADFSVLPIYIAAKYALKYLGHSELLEQNSGNPTSEPGGLSAFLSGFAKGLSRGDGAGFVSDGLIAGATVFRDTNGNGLLDLNEVSTLSDAAGVFDGLAGSGVIVAIGGVDSQTGLALETPLRAPEGSRAVTPITTLIVDVQQQLGIGVSAAEQMVSGKLGLPTGQSPLTSDYLSLAVLGDHAGLVAVAQAANTAALIGAATSGGESEGLSKLASFLAVSGPSVDLSDLSTVQAMLSGLNLDPALQNALSAFIVESNGHLARSASSASADLVVEVVSGFEQQVQGAVADALRDVAPDQQVANLAAFDPAGVPHTEVFTDGNGHTVTDTLDVNNKLVMEVVAEAAGGAVLSTRMLNYDDQGLLARDQTNFRDGHQQITVNDTANTHSFATNNLLTDVHGNVTINQLIYDDGHQTVTYNDLANIQPWLVNNLLTDTHGNLTVNQLIYDDGHQTVTYNDIANVQPWRVNNLLNDAAGRASTNQLIYDDGHQTVTINDLANVQPWTTNNLVLDAAGKLVTNQLIYDDGHQAIQVNDVANVQAWTTNNLVLDAAGKLVTNQLIYDDGHQEITNYDVANTQPYTSNSIVLDPRGALVANSTIFDDGHVEQFHI